jgi:hypothetical protein
VVQLFRLLLLLPSLLWFRVDQALDYIYLWGEDIPTMLTPPTLPVWTMLTPPTLPVWVQSRRLGTGRPFFVR